MCIFIRLAADIRQVTSIVLDSQHAFLHHTSWSLPLAWVAVEN
jgi:hypothetical protein